MSLGRRITIAAAGAVGIAVLIASVVAYVVMRAELRGEVDDSLRERAQVFEELGDQLPFGGAPPGISPPGTLLGGAGGYVHLVSATGETTRPGGEPLALPVDDETLGLAREGGDETLSDAPSTAATSGSSPCPSTEGARFRSPGRSTRSTRCSGECG